MGRSRMKDTSQTIPFNTNNIIACKRFMEAKIDGILIIMCRKIRLILVCLIAISSLQSQAQALYGTTGLLHAPTAEMQRDKTFMAGGNVLHLVPLQYISSNEIKYTFNYYLNITIFPWLEVGYTCTINYAEHGSTYFPEQSWGKKEVKDWDFVRDKNGNIVIDESHPNWWQDKKNPDRHGIRIPVLDENGIQKIGARNRLQWKRVLTDATGWNNPKNCELWRSEWAKVCNEHLPLHNQVDHRSYEKQGKLQIPTIHEGADARKIEQKFLAGQEIKGSWKVAENQIIKQQNTLLQKILDTFGKVSGALSLWKERLNDIRRKPGNYTLNGIHDWANRRTADLNGRNDSGNAEPGHSTLSYAKTESEITKIKQRVIRAAQHFAKYRGTAFQDGRTENEDRTFGKRKSAMAEIGTESEQRKQFITETEHRIAELEQQVEKGRDIDERIQRIKERRTVGRTSALDRGDTRRVGTERPAYRGTEDAAQRISDLEREIKQREQSREYSSIKERLEAGRQSIADREREVAKRKRHDRGMSR